MITLQRCASFGLLVLICKTPLVGQITTQVQHAGQQAPLRPNPLFDPHWIEGDSWQVVFGYDVPLVGKEPNTPESGSVSFLYTYTVLPNTREPGLSSEPIVKILVHSEDELGDWILTFARKQVALLRIEEVVGSGTNLSHLNPFGADSWLANLDQFSRIIIHDFPRIPGVDVIDRLVLGPDTGTPPFTETVTFGATPAGRPSMEAILKRPEPTTGFQQRTRIKWLYREKWWSRATVVLGNDVQVTGRLVRN